MRTHPERGVPALHAKASLRYGIERWCSEVRWCLAERLRSARAGTGLFPFERVFADSESIVLMAWIYLLWCASCVDARALHPKHFPEIFIDASGAVAMGASRKQCRVFRSKRRTKYDLIDVSPAGRAGFASDLSANGSYLADLFLHLLPPCPGLFLMSYRWRRWCQDRRGGADWKYRRGRSAPTERGRRGRALLLLFDL